MPEILNKKQLEDAIKCRDFGTGCCDKNKKRCSAGGVGMCIENAAQTALAYRELAEKRRLMLKQLEWKGYDIIVEACCPICHNREEEGHEEGCELAALLKESEGESC
jgi:hypothetical protein